MLTRRVRRMVPALAAAVAMLALPGQRAAADPFNPVPVFCDHNPVPGCTVRAGTPGEPGNPEPGGRGGGSSGCHDPAGAAVPCFVAGRGSLGSDGCYYQRSGASPPPSGSAGPGAWYVRTCEGPAMNGPLGVPLVGGLVWLPDGAGPVSPEVLARQAVSRLNLSIPQIRVNPAPPANQVVFVPTWVWLAPESWGNRSATASVPGMSVTATATPVKLVLSTAGQGVTCQGPGTAWTPGRDAAAASPTCGVTYHRPGTFALQATVTWTVSWAGGGATGTVPALTTTASVDLQVVEAGGLNGNGGHGA